VLFLISDTNLNEMTGFLYEWSNSGYERAILFSSLRIDTSFRNSFVLVLLPSALFICFLLDDVGYPDGTVSLVKIWQTGTGYLKNGN